MQSKRQQGISLARRALLAALLTITATALSPAAPAYAATCTYENLVPSPTTVIKVRAATRCLINRERTRYGRKALLASGQLRKAAERHSHQMVRQGFFGHTGPGGSTVDSRVARGTSYLRGARRASLAENLAMGSPELSTARQTVRMWMSSSGHRRNILDRRFRHIGTGIAPGAPQSAGGMAAYTIVFGARF